MLGILLSEARYSRLLPYLNPNVPFYFFFLSDFADKTDFMFIGTQSVHPIVKLCISHLNKS